MNRSNAERLADSLVQEMYSSFDLPTLEELAEIGARYETLGLDPKVDLLNAAIRREIERRKATQ